MYDDADKQLQRFSVSHAKLLCAKVSVFEQNFLTRKSIAGVSATQIPMNS
jgi:hypothetical protein